MIRADFHIHTNYSRCSNMKPADMLKAAISKGYDCIGVVDHNNIKGGLMAKKLAGRRIAVIPGEEIRTDRGEVIILLSDGLYSRNLEEVIDRARDEGHFVIVPHPFDSLREGSVGKNIEMARGANAIEVFNSRVVLNRFNAMARRFAKKSKMAPIVGSDAHFLEEIGNAANILECENNPDSIFEAISKKRAKFFCKKSSVAVHMKSTLNPLSRLLYRIAAESI